jgi:vacuolar iron transporter family protein
MNRTERKQCLANLQGETDGVALYVALAEAENNPKLAEVYRRLAATEKRHAAVWSKKLRDAGHKVPELAPSLRTRILVGLARRFGVGLVLPTIASREQVDSHGYARQAAAGAEMAADEKSHARLLRRITQTGVGGLEGSAVMQLEGRHRATGGNALRAAVLGANDGLVSNLSLVMGVAGASLSSRSVLITGFAGLLAGAVSMALGEWLSVQSSRELYEHQIETEREELAAFPEEETEELTLIYEAKGLETSRARELARQIMSDESQALDTLVREEIGIDPNTLGGSAWGASLTSFLLFALGAIVPVIPFLFWERTRAVAFSLAASTAALFLVGAAITLFTGRKPIAAGARQVLFGLAAAAVTYGIGRLIGGAITG